MLTVINFKKVVFCLLWLLLFTISGVTANEFQDNFNQQAEYELYVTADQLVLCSEGIFVNYRDLGLLRVGSLYSVSPGIYLVNAATECPKHGQYCPRCGGCDPKNRCQYRCKCPERRQLNE